VAARLSAALTEQSTMIPPQDGDSCSVRLVVPQERLAACTDLLERVFFSDVDPNVFAPPDSVPQERQT
jgi:hypothetical protein